MSIHYLISLEKGKKKGDRLLFELNRCHCERPKGAWQSLLKDKGEITEKTGTVLMNCQILLTKYL